VVDFFRLVSAEAMPQLRRLTVSASLRPPAAGNEERKAAALLQRMSLIALSITECDALIPLLHHLSHLQELTLSGCGPWDSVLALLQQWWCLMGCSPLHTEPRVTARAREQRTLADALGSAVAVVGAPAALRELSFHDQRDMPRALPAAAFPYLAHLPNLRVLECRLLDADLDALGLLPQLEELRLWAPCFGRDGWVSSSCKPGWYDDSLCTLGELPLPCLHMLRLLGDDEDFDGCNETAKHEFAVPNDPDVPSGNITDEGTEDDLTTFCAGVVSGVTLKGLTALLQLAALTALGLPWIDERLLDDFRRLALQKGRVALRMERIVPLSRRTRLERHWLDTERVNEEFLGPSEW